MVKATHTITTATVVSIPFLIVPNDYYMLYILTAVIGTLLPDLLENFITTKHRTTTHNIIYVTFVSLVLFLFEYTFIATFFLGYILHIMLDSCSKIGVKGALYPITSKEYVFALLPYKLRYKVGGKGELFIFLIFALLMYLIHTKLG